MSRDADPPGILLFIWLAGSCIAWFAIWAALQHLGLIGQG